MSTKLPQKLLQQITSTTTNSSSKTSTRNTSRSKSRKESRKEARVQKKQNRSIRSSLGSSATTIPSTTTSATRNTHSTKSGKTKTHSKPNTSTNSRKLEKLSKENPGFYKVLVESGLTGDGTSNDTTSDGKKKVELDQEFFDDGLDYLFPVSTFSITKDTDALSDTSEVPNDIGSDTNEASNTNNTKEPKVDIYGRDIPTSKETSRPSTNNTTNIDPVVQKKIKGMLNKLTLQNFLTLIKDIDQLMLTSSRNAIISTVINCIHSSIGSMFDYKIVVLFVYVLALKGLPVWKLVYELVDYYFTLRTTATTSATSDVEKKKMMDIITLLSYMYTFQIIQHTLLFDLLKVSISSLNDPQMSDLDIEIILKVVQVCGYKMRMDDPGSVGELVDLVTNSTKGVNTTAATMNTSKNNTSATVTDKETKLTRFKFMIEQLQLLKHNRKQQEDLKQYFQVLKGLGRVEALGISLDDLRSGRGQWWVVGGVWKDEGAAADGASGKDSTTNTKDKDTTDLLTLSRLHKMNTSLRQLIFTTVVSSLSPHDCILKLQKVKKEREVLWILVYCCCSERVYNPFYESVIVEFCGTGSMNMSSSIIEDTGSGVSNRNPSNNKKKREIGFVIKDFVKTIDMTTSDTTTVIKLRNLTRLVATLITKGVMGLNLVWGLDIVFVEVVLEVLVGSTTDEEEWIKPFQSVTGDWRGEMVMLLRSMTRTRDPDFKSRVGYITRMLE